MQVSITESGVIERKLRVSVPHAEVQNAIDAKLRSVAARARIPGFRPGKAPADIVARRYGEQVRHEVITDEIESSYREAIKREEIVPAGLVSIEPQPFEDGADLQYVATIDLYPKIPAPTLAGRRFEKPVCEIAPDDVERTVQNIRRRHAEFSPKDGKAAAGDRLTVDFTGEIDGKPFENADGNEHQFVLGDGHLISGFDKLAGARRGDERRIAHEFPADYPDPAAAGKRAEFLVKVRAVESAKLPELNNEFAKQLGIAEGGMAKMRAEIESSLQRELRMRMRGALRERVMTQLLEINEIPVPRGLVEAEKKRRMQALRESFNAPPGKEPELPPQEQARFDESARRGVALALVVGEIIEQNGMKPDPELVETRLRDAAREYNDREQIIAWYKSDPARMRRLEESALEEQVVMRMIETADVVEKRVSFKDFMASESAASSLPEPERESA